VSKRKTPSKELARNPKTPYTLIAAGYAALEENQLTTQGWGKSDGKYIRFT
jgi:hypothetical protein